MLYMNGYYILYSYMLYMNVIYTAYSLVFKTSFLENPGLTNFARTAAQQASEIHLQGSIP